MSETAAAGEPWLHVIGMGEDGFAGLSPRAAAALKAAEVIVGARRLLDMVPLTEAQRIVWTSLEATLAEIESRRGRNVAVLASGNPMWHGLGGSLARRFSPAEMDVHPSPSAFVLACARMGWPMEATVPLSVHNAPLEIVGRHLYPGARLVVLSRDAETPGSLAAYLTERGFGASLLTVFEAMGGARERRIAAPAAAWGEVAGDPLNTVAVEVIADAGARIFGLVPGLPDSAYMHDGMLTKREIRAITLSALAPCPGETLWDVGAGSGSISVEWLRANPRGRAVAVECEPERAQVLRLNAERLGAPGVEVVEGRAPEVLAGIPGSPDAVFVGGGVTSGATLAACWARLKKGGRLVVNVVTLESAAHLIAFRVEHGGTLTQILISREAPVGGMTRFESMAPVIQYAGVKS